MKSVLVSALLTLTLSGFSISRAIAQCGGIPDLVIINANIITMNPDQPAASAMAIQDGMIQLVGDVADIIPMIPEGCAVQWIDAAGLTILPGFNDSHCHWLSWPEHICDAPGQEETTYPELSAIMGNLSMNGWTSISELNFGRPDLVPAHLQNALALEATGDLNVRLNGYWGTYDDTNLIEVLQDYGYEAGHKFSDRIRAPGVKIYVDDPFGTMDIMEQSTCNQLVVAAHNAGYQVAAHAVNQSAVGKILTAYETALGGSNNNTIRHRIEHAVKVSDSQMLRIANKGILVSFQLMGPPDWPEQNTFQTYISNTDTDYVLRWKDFTETNIPLVGSTDAPFNNTVCDYSPFRAIYQTVTRLGYIDRTHASWELAQRIAIQDGLKLLTIDGAWATNEEAIKGSIQPGKYADLIIVSRDPLSVNEPAELLEIHPLLTMVGGDVEFCSNELPDLCPVVYAFVVDTVIVTVQNYLTNQKPGLAFDQDEETNWNAGFGPPQYIQVDLLKDTPLEKIELTVDQFPAGFTRHQILGAKDGLIHQMELLHEFTGNTSTLDKLIFNFNSVNHLFRYIRIATLQSPSWVSWREIRLQSENQTAIEEPHDQLLSAIMIYPNPAKHNIHIIPPKVVNAAISIGIINLRGEWMLRDQFLAGEKIDMNVESLPSGMYFVEIRNEAGREIKKLVIL